MAEPLPASQINRRTAEMVEPIEHAHLRLIHHLGIGPDGRPTSPTSPAQTAAV